MSRCFDLHVLFVQQAHLQSCSLDEQYDGGKEYYYGGNFNLVNGVWLTKRSSLDDMEYE